MAKTAKVKAKPQSTHSRAARRAASPSLDLDKSLKSLPRVEETEKNPATLAAIHNTGISKKRGNNKAKSRSQRMRQEKAMDRAEAVMDKTETKLKKSLGKSKVVQNRRATWEDHNEKLIAARKLAAEEEEAKAKSQSQDGDVEMGVENGSRKASSSVPAPITPMAAVVPAPPANPEADELDVDIT